jgi:hypothetical protein
MVETTPLGFFWFGHWSFRSFVIKPSTKL